MRSNAQRSAKKRPPQSRREQAVIFALVVIGFGLFVVATAGVTLLPFDQHHYLTKVLGLAIVLGALMRWR